MTILFFVSGFYFINNVTIERKESREVERSVCVLVYCDLYICAMELCIRNKNRYIAKEYRLKSWQISWAISSRNVHVLTRMQHIATDVHILYYTLSYLRATTTSTITTNKERVTNDDNYDELYLFLSYFLQEFILKLKNNIQSYYFSTLSLSLSLSFSFFSPTLAWKYMRRISLDDAPKMLQYLISQNNKKELWRRAGSENHFSASFSSFFFCFPLTCLMYAQEKLYKYITSYFPGRCTYYPFLLLLHKFQLVMSVPHTRLMCIFTKYTLKNNRVPNAFFHKFILRMIFRIFIGKIVYDWILDNVINIEFDCICDGIGVFLLHFFVVALNLQLYVLKRICFYHLFVKPSHFRVTAQINVEHLFSFDLFRFISLHLFALMLSAHSRISGASTSPNCLLKTWQNKGINSNGFFTFSKTVELEAITKAANLLQIKTFHYIISHFFLFVELTQPVSLSFTMDSIELDLSSFFLVVVANNVKLMFGLICINAK